MIPFRNNFLLFIIISLASLPSRAQENFQAVHWGAGEKMQVGWVIGMIKDANGFMWIGTGGQGLFRFDGSVFKNYLHETSENDRIPGSDIRGLIEDSLHNIWIGTENGLCLYDINQDTFRIVALAIKNPLGRSIVPFWATKDEVFCWDYRDFNWVAFNSHTLSKRSLAKISPDDIEKDWFADRFSVFDAGSNSIWIEKDSGGSSDGGLLQVSLSTSKKLSFSWDCYQNITNHGHSFQCMQYDRRRNAIWINSSDGLVEFTLRDKKFHRVAAMDSLVRQKSFQQRAGINIDDQDRIWMGTYPKGIIIYDPASQSLQLPFPSDSTLQQNISASNLMIYCDRDGMIWSGSFDNQNGFYQLIPFSPPVNQFISERGKSNSLSNDFAVFCKDAGQGKVLIGTGDGLNIFDPETGFFQVLRKNDLRGLKSDLPGLKAETHEMQPISIDTLTQKAWITIDRRYYQMDMRSKQCSPVIFEDSNNQKLPDQGSLPRPFKNGSVLCIDYGNRTLVFVGNSDSSVAKQILSFPAGSIDGLYVASDEDHLLFFRRDESAFNLSYILVHGKWILTHTAMDSIRWVNIMFNKSDRSYWINTKQSLLHLSGDFRPIRVYAEKDGLPVGDRGWVIPDNNGNTWFTTEHSIHRLDIESGRISTLSERDGFRANGFWIGLMICKSVAGDLYIPSGAGGKGFTRITPAKYAYGASTVYIQSLLINQLPYHFSPGIKNKPEIFLKYFENRFTIEPGIIDFNSAGKNQFRYKLGESAEWIYPYNNIIYYDNLAPGNYDLIMQASNSNVFNSPATTLHVHISPPWYQTWWAYATAVICLIAVLYCFLRYRVRQKFLKHMVFLQKEKQMADMRQKAAELQQQKTELEMQALRAQMNPHFIFNSLNSINHFILQNNKIQASEYLTKFSKLVRMILQNSQASSIPLESELEALKLYIEMEVLRFNHHFDYKISTSNDLDIELLKVPPLIIQPYVENAIWHGLMHKEEKGHLDIEVSQEDENLYFKITDNGIGRKQAGMLASKSARKHKSLALQITAGRIAILQNSSRNDSPVTINDLVNTDGIGSGTEVIIKIPVTYD